jgi:hypothetical protein
MTSKEKADDLVNQFRMILMDEDTDCGNECLCTIIAIKCAKVVANEFWKYEHRLFWMDVSKELDKL